MAVDQVDEETIDRAFGSENRNRLIGEYFEEKDASEVTPEKAWAHVYKLLLWSDPTTGLAHCYESDKSQPGKPWYARTLSFHDWLCSALHSSPDAVARQIDWLFLRACAELTADVLRKASGVEAKAAEQRLPYEGRSFPKAGEDPELVGIVKEVLGPFLDSDPGPVTWSFLIQKIRQYLAVQNKRKNLVGEGFEDVLTHVVHRTCNVPSGELHTRRLLYEIPGFNRAKQGQKENKVDLAITRPSLRTIVTAKWSIRADREKQFPAELGEYVSANSRGERFAYVLVTNEFDPARLQRACEQLFANAYMFDRVVHINTDAIIATYGTARQSTKKSDESKRRVLKYIDNGRLISLEKWLASL